MLGAVLVEALRRPKKICMFDTWVFMEFSGKGWVTFLLKYGRPLKSINLQMVTKGKESQNAGRTEQARACHDEIFTRFITC